MEPLIITISRTYGSRGRDIGIQLAKELGIDFYGKQELMAIAKQTRDYSKVRAFYEEQPVSSLLFAIAVENSSQVRGDLPFDFIRKLTDGKSFVMVEQCGSYIFRDSPRCLRLFIHAPVRTRAEHRSKVESIPVNKILRIVQAHDRERSAFHRYYTGEEWGRAEVYDLCLSSDALGVEGTVEFIKDYLKRRGMI